MQVVYVCRYFQHNRGRNASEDAGLRPAPAPRGPPPVAPQRLARLRRL